MITIENLSISYSNGNMVIDSLNLDIADSSIHGIVGLNGAGKTTLLNAFFGLKKVEAGTILWNENKLNRNDISYLVSEPYFYPNITGNEYLSLFKGENFDSEKWNELFHLPLKNTIDTYSTGMRKKLAILSVIKQDKPILILDEPFNSLDVETCRNIRSILLGLKGKGKLIIITSHIVETLTNLCDYIHFLEGGRIKFSKEKNDFEEFEKELFQSIENKSINLISELLK